MDIFRKLIIERTKQEVEGSWTLDIYYYLLGHGVSSIVAVKEMASFVDDVISMKERHTKHE